MNSPRIGTAAILSIAAVALSACGGNTAGTTESGVPLVQEGQLTTCTHLSYQPFQFEDGDDIVGFDVDIVDAIAEELGVEQEIVNTPFEPVTTGAVFQQNKCDLAAAAITINPEREEVLDFSDPYFDANQAILTSTDKTASDEAGLSGFKLAGQVGTTGLTYAQENLTDAKIIEYDDLPLSLEALKTGQVDAVINDNGVLYDYANNNEGFEVGFDIDTGESYGIAMKKGNTQLRDTANQVLADMKSDGRYDEIYEKWFGDVPAPK